MGVGESAMTDKELVEREKSWGIYADLEEGNLAYRDKKQASDFGDRQNCKMTLRSYLR